ncbi:hypothetical protein [Ectopseudomonas mendocina]|uniref:hypothetical protein n=1 Tax=Ectopseudomonas mendocina TaxID=300 RepID=UPI00373FDB50
MESFFRSLKAEQMYLILRQLPRSEKRPVRLHSVYNQRCHSTLGYISSIEFERQKASSSFNYLSTNSGAKYPQQIPMPNVLKPDAYHKSNI